MVADLPIVHLFILLANSICILDAHAREVVSQSIRADHSVVLLLNGGKAAVDNKLSFRRHLYQHIFLQASEEERAKDLVELCDYGLLFLGADYVVDKGVLADVPEAEPGRRKYKKERHDE